LQPDLQPARLCADGRLLVTEGEQSLATGHGAKRNLPFMSALVLTTCEWAACQKISTTTAFCGRFARWTGPATLPCCPENSGLRGLTAVHQQGFVRREEGVI
jgi:hypothetical protein